jgi:hypothetical protein
MYVWISDTVLDTIYIGYICTLIFEHLLSYCGLEVWMYDNTNILLELNIFNNNGRVN